MRFQLLRLRLRFRPLWHLPGLGHFRLLPFHSPLRRRLRQRRVRPLRYQRNGSPLEMLRLNQTQRREQLKPLPLGQRAQQQRMARALDRLDLGQR